MCLTGQQTNLLSIAEQLTDIYFNQEHWHLFKMPYKEALHYHQSKLDKGNIHVYEVEGKVLGYYERYLIGDYCFLNNVLVLPGEDFGIVFKELKKHFFKTMPDNIKSVVGLRVKLGGKLVERKIYGKH